MTYEEREQIFAKEVLTLDDFMKLFSVGKSSACTLMGNAKRGIEFSGKNLRLKKEGQIHVQDFFDYYRLNPADYRPTTSIVLAKSLIDAAVNEYLKPILIAQKSHNSNANGKETNGT